MESNYNTRNMNDSWIQEKKKQAATDVNTIKSTHVRLKSLNHYALAWSERIADTNSDNNKSAVDLRIHTHTL